MAHCARGAALKIGITTFLSGAASVFGVPAKAAAEILIDDLNAKGGIGGVKVVPTFIDEGIGGDKLLSEYRRLVQEQGVRTMLAAISSGNCNIIAPVAAQMAARLEETLAIVPELRGLLPRSAAALSGGQGKMAALGRAIMAGERIVLLDEPFQGLAPVLAAQYGLALRRLQAARPQLAIVITESNRSLLDGIAARTLVLERGELEQTG